MYQIEKVTYRWRLYCESSVMILFSLTAQQSWARREVEVIRGSLIFDLVKRKTSQTHMRA